MPWWKCCEHFRIVPLITHDSSFLVPCRKIRCFLRWFSCRWFLLSRVVAKCLNCNHGIQLPHNSASRSVQRIIQYLRNTSSESNYFLFRFQLQTHSFLHQIPSSSPIFVNSIQVLYRVFHLSSEVLNKLILVKVYVHASCQFRQWNYQDNWKELEIVKYVIN